jgi:hypothetical protein
MSRRWGSEDAAVASRPERSFATSTRFSPGTRADPLPAWDQAVLKRAMNAYKKRLVMRADERCAQPQPPLRGASSGIQARPRAVHAGRLGPPVAQGRLRDGGQGLLEPAGEAGWG